MGLKLVFLIVARAVSLLGLSRREEWWKDAEILMLRRSGASSMFLGLVFYQAVDTIDPPKIKSRSRVS